jgi:hypothetical protein
MIVSIVFGAAPVRARASCSLLFVVSDAASQAGDRGNEARFRDPCLVTAGLGRIVADLIDLALFCRVIEPWAIHVARRVLKCPIIAQQKLVAKQRAEIVLRRLAFLPLRWVVFVVEVAIEVPHLRYLGSSLPPRSPASSVTKIGPVMNPAPKNSQSRNVMNTSPHSYARVRMRSWHPHGTSWPVGWDDVAPCDRHQSP